MASAFSNFKPVKNREDSSNFDDSCSQSIAAARSSSSENFVALEQFCVRRASEPTDEGTSERTSDRAKQTKHHEMDLEKFVPCTCFDTKQNRNGRDFHRNPRFSLKSEIFSEIRDFRRNQRFLPKSEFFVEIADFRRNLRFSPKSEIFAEVRDFCRNPRFSSKLEARALARSER